jgi:hypothetical protein
MAHFMLAVMPKDASGRCQQPKDNDSGNCAGSYLRLLLTGTTDLFAT